MTEKTLEVGLNEADEIVINHPALGDTPGHIVFSPEQARGLADSLRKHANTADHNRTLRALEEKRKIAESIPVDRTARTLTDGSPVTDDHREIDPSSGQQKNYVVLSAEERAKGFVRPLRRSYIHDACGCTTSMGLALCETYARDPYFYSGTFCSICRAHFPLEQFKWSEDGEVVGT